jgi:predicted nuclease of predicted toxin-antitoxin system
MKFLTDQDVYAATVRFLISLGHDVVTAAQLGLSQAEDEDVLAAQTPLFLLLLRS